MSNVPKSSDGTPAIPTPMVLPTVGGIATGILASALGTKIGPKLGLTPDQLLILSGSIVAGTTSLWHKIAQKVHWL